MRLQDLVHNDIIGVGYQCKGMLYYEYSEFVSFKLIFALTSRPSLTLFASHATLFIQASPFLPTSTSAI